VQGGACQEFRPRLCAKIAGLGDSIRVFHLHKKAIAILCAVATLPYLPLLVGVYLFDDIQLIENNYTLKTVRRLADVFTFVLKPSKPVSNFVLAWGEYWGHGMVPHQRLLSMALHAAVVLLFYFLLHALRRRLPARLPRRFPFWVALLFAVTPLHSEAIGIAWFRMDMLGAFFTLLGMLATLHLTEKRPAGWYALLFLSLGLGTFSKETFAVVLPLAVLSVGWVTPGFGRRQVVAVALMQCFWGGILYWLLTKDATSQFPYDDVIGWGILELPLQIRLAASSLIEGIYKTLSGHGLTIVRLQERFAVGIGLGVPGAVAILVLWVSVLVWLIFKGGFLRVLGALLAISETIYLVIPNLNIGSEHYWYLPAAPLLALVMYGVWRAASRFTDRPARVMTFAVALYAVALGMGTESRVLRMMSREKFYRGEWQRHPESVGTWSDMAVVLMEKKKFDEAQGFLTRAKAMDPTHPNVLISEFLLAFHRGDLKGARETFAAIHDNFKARPHLLGLFYFHLGMLEEKAKSPAAAARSYLKALEQEPHVKFYRDVYEKNVAAAK